MKVMEGLPPGEVKDAYQKLLGVLSLQLKKPEEKRKSFEESA